MIWTAQRGKGAWFENGRDMVSYLYPVPRLLLRGGRHKRAWYTVDACANTIQSLLNVASFCLTTSHRIH